MERYKIKPQLRVKEVENHSGMIGHRTKDNLITRFRVVFASCHFRIMSRINVEEWKEDGDYSKRYENSINCIPTNFFIIHLFTCAYIIWVISPFCPTSTFFRLPPPFQEEPVLCFSSVPLKSRNKQ
jgi:hypothetical protein